MSIKIMSKVFENESLGPTQKLILLSLADHANDEGQCYPSIPRLCRRTGLKERAVQSNIRALQEAGYLDVQLNAGRKGSNLYVVRATPAADAPPQEMHPALNAPHPRSRCTPTPAADAPEPSRNRQEPSDKDQSASDPRFSEFWSSWPLRKVGKKKAEAAFNRLSKQNRRMAIDRVRSWAEAWRAANPTASDIHPSTYLNGKRWEDDFGLSPPSSSSVANLNKWKRMVGK